VGLKLTRPYLGEWTPRRRAFTHNSPTATLSGPSGLVHDRRWAVVDGAGAALGPRRCAALCMLRPSVDLQRGVLRLEAPSCPCAAEVELKAGGGPAGGLSTWLEAALGVPGCRLVELPSGDPLVPKLSVGLGGGSGSGPWREEGSGDQAAASADRRRATAAAGRRARFSNGAPLLLASSASLASLARGAGMGCEPAETFAARFRPNLVVGGPGVEAYAAEERWAEAGALLVGEQHYAVRGACPRCSRVCLDPGDGG
jgi:molybdenum cofactor sulfurtransferase